jgi:hypothetical protein
MASIRQTVERTLVRACVNSLLVAGFALSVNDGSEFVLQNSRNRDAIFAALFSTDEDYLVTHKTPQCSDGAPSSGWVRFIYGNDGHDVINDYTTNLEPWLGFVNRLADRIENGAFEISFPDSEGDAS